MKLVSTLKNGFVRKRPKPPPQLAIVYHLLRGVKTACSWSDVDQTGRTLDERKLEQKRIVRDFDTERSEVACHVREMDHQFVFDDR